MKKITLLATTLLVTTFLVACSELSTTNEASKTSSTSQLEKSEGTAKIQPAKNFSNTPIGEYELADSNLYGVWPDDTKLVIDDPVEQVVDPSTVFTKYLIHLNGDKDSPVILKVFVNDGEDFDVTKVSKFYVRTNIKERKFLCS